MQLVLNTYGTSLSKKDNMFYIQHKDGAEKLATNNIRSILITKGARISSDAVILAVDNEIEIVFTDKSGFPRGRVWSHKYGSVSTIRKNQVHFASKKPALELIKWTIILKIQHQINLIDQKEKVNNRAICQSAKEYLQAKINQIRALKGNGMEEIAPSLRGIEGAASRQYFKWITNTLPKIYAFEKRSRRPAKDMFNAVINYLYGMLYVKVEGALIIAGLDPYVGFFHRDEYNRPVLVYDLIEPYRPWVDHIALTLCDGHIITEDLFSTYKVGFWLEKTGRAIVIEAFNDHFSEVINYNKRRRSRAIHIELDCQDLAQKILKYKV